MTYFLQGLTLGLAYVAPIGVQNIFVINSGLSQKKSRAYMTALIIVFFDVSLALICFFGVGLLLDQISILKKIVLLVGGIIVMFMGIMLMKPPKKVESNDDDDSKDKLNNAPILKVIGTACVVTWFNPQAWLDGSLMLGAFKASLPPDKSALFIIGVAISSCLWFLTLTTITTVFKSKFSPKILRGINVVCGAIIFIYALKLIWSFVQLF